ncbi:MAG: MFS transporter [Thermoanaerobacterales bacterium]|nr:MFS transporter [Bacillota bacterium]MDI6907334.1 MFS transporter [Thermoanaerobacterales bacterium]
MAKQAPGAAASPAGAGGARPVLWTRDFTLICIYNLVIFVGFQMLMPTVSVYVDAMGGSRLIVGLVTGIFTVSSVAVRPLTGLGLDRHGRRGIWLVGAAVFTLAVAGYNGAATVALLLVLRVIHGVGWGIVTTSAATVATDLVPLPRRGEGMGFFGLGANLGMAVGPILGFFAANHYGFPALFWSTAVLSLLALLVITTIRVPPVRARHGGPPPALWEPSALKPSLVMYFATFTWGGVTTFIALHAGQHGITNAGVYFTVYAITLMLARPTMGMLFDRYGHRVVIIPGLILLSAGMAILGLATNLPMFLAAAVVSGLGFGAIHPALQALAVAACAPTRRGAAQATFTSSFDLGIGSGAVLLGFLAQFAGYQWMYMASAGVALAGLAVYLALRDWPAPDGPCPAPGR